MCAAASTARQGSPVSVTPIDVLGHGTFVAGVIGAKNNNFGVIGTAPGTPLLVRPGCR